jgi:16S rRNA (cytosine967-C5)-methyltransferase
MELNPDRRLRAVNASAPAPACAAPLGASLPLAQLLGHTADAVQAVRAGQSLTAALAQCPAAARPGTQALSFHALRWLGSAQALRALLAPKPPAPAVDALLLTALALLWPQAGAQASGPTLLPYAEHTLVDQAVDAARRRAKASAAFVNAVLRRFLRERDALVAAALRDPLARFNHPAWWIDRLKADWPAQWAAILDANNRRAPMTLRVNARRSSAAVYAARLVDHGMACTVVGPQAVALAQPCPVAQLPGFAHGDVSVQDVAAQLAAPLLIGAGLARNARVLDACAAPGGKTAHLLELADLDVLAIDRDPARLPRVVETLARLGLAARTQAADAADPAAWWDGTPFDAILLDAPCSASGIVRRHPDVRWLRRSTDIAALAATQDRLLDALWPLLKPGGRLLYCTCSVFRAEGQVRIDAFLQRHRDASVAASPPSPGHLLPLPDNGAERSAPGGGETPDGFFLALIAKA